MMKQDTQLAPNHSPWGPVQHAKMIAEGLWSVSTASHGGFYALDGVIAQMPEDLASIRTPYSNFPWYEEDCDWAILAVALPQYFEPQSVKNAILTAQMDRDYKPMMQVAAWLKANPNNAAQRKAEAC